jgi:hypothetical protein
MKAICNTAERLLAVGSLLAICLTGVRADEPHLQKSEGHVSPLRVKLTFEGGATETGLLTNAVWSGLGSDVFHFYGDSLAGGHLKLWMDTISSIEEMNEKGALVLFKNGEKRRIVPGIFVLELTGSEGSKESVERPKLRSIKFMQPPHQDKLHNAMYPNWRYSPFTGERLPLE